MTELSPAFELLRKIFIVAGILGAIEVTALVIAFILMANEPRIRDWGKRLSRK